MAKIIPDIQAVALDLKIGSLHHNRAHDPHWFVALVHLLF